METCPQAEVFALRDRNSTAVEQRPTDRPLTGDDASPQCLYPSERRSGAPVEGELSTIGDADLIPTERTFFSEVIVK